MKKRHGVKDGSIVIMTLMFMTVMVIIAYSMLRTSLYSISLATEREKYEQQYQLARALEVYGLFLYKQKGENLGVLFKNKWPSADSCYEGFVELEQKDDMPKMLHTSLKHNKKVIITFSIPITSKKE